MRIMDVRAMPKVSLKALSVDQKALARGVSMTLMVVMMLVLPGCVVRAPQLESIAASVQGWFAEDEPAAADFRWTARVGSEGRLLTLYEVENQLLFASDDGVDLVLFDGWVIRRVQGFGLSARLDIQDKDDRRTYRYEKMRQTTACQPFENARRALQDGMLRMQYCAMDGNSKPNVTITLDAVGDIVAIEQALGVEGLRVELRRLRPQQ